MRGMLLGTFVVALEEVGALEGADFDVTGVVIESGRLKASGSICMVVVVVIGEAGNRSDVRTW